MANTYIEKFDKLFIDWMYDYIKSDKEFEKITDNVNLVVNSPKTNSWLYIRNIDYFNSLGLCVDLDLIVIPELLKTFDQNFQRVLMYQVSIDYNPLTTKWKAINLMNKILNIQEGTNIEPVTEISSQVGYTQSKQCQYLNLPTDYTYDYTTISSDITFNSDETFYELGYGSHDRAYQDLISNCSQIPGFDQACCILFSKPSSQKRSPSDRANYIRQTIDMNFLIMVNRNVIVCGS